MTTVDGRGGKGRCGGVSILVNMRRGNSIRRRALNCSLLSSHGFIQFPAPPPPIHISLWMHIAEWCERLRLQCQSRNQCCGSGIQCLFDPWIRDPGWVKNKDEHPGSYFRELRNNFLGYKYLRFLMRIRLRDQRQHCSQQSWVHFQHPPTQWNLRGGRWSSGEESM